MDEAALTAKGAATRSRILAAATGEFAEHGLAGARVDRIAEAARTNKAQLYAYFGNKEQLFDTVFASAMQHIVEVVPISADDLADWAVRLYDEYLERPELIRLATWARLERTPRGHLMGEQRLDADKLASIKAAQQEGAFGEVVAGAEPFDVMAMVIAMSMAWSPVSNVYSATADEPARVHRRRRAFLRSVIQGALVS